jgi:hypothetical protein
MSAVSQSLRQAPALAHAASRPPLLPLSRVWAFASVALPVVASLKASMSSVDLAYQVRAGDVMLRHHSLLRHDVFSFSAFGKPWTDQQWGAQLLFGWVFRVGGWPALALLRATLVGAIYLLVFLACRKAGAAVRTAALLTLASFGVSAEGLALRPQLLAMALFALCVYLLASRSRSRAWRWAIPLAVAVWANVHGSFFLGPLLVGLALLDDLANSDRRATGASRSTGVVFLASLAASLANPFGVRIWTYAVSISTNDVITRFISEWQPPSVREIAGATFFLSGGAVVALLARRGRPTPWPTQLALGVFFAIGLEAIRGIFWWALLTPVLIVPLLPAARARRTDEPIGVQEGPGGAGGTSPRGSPALNLVIVAAIVLLGIVFLPWWRGHSRRSPSPDLIADAPLGVTAAVQRWGPPGTRIFNPQIWGSWFELAEPDDPVFVDSRIEVFPISVWRDYQDVSVGRQGWQGVLDRWRIGIVVLSPKQQRDLIPLIRRDAGWRLVHEDRDGLVFARASG